jgi:hypothetical protein
MVMTARLTIVCVYGRGIGHLLGNRNMVYLDLGGAFMGEYKSPGVHLVFVNFYLNEKSKNTFLKIII